MAYIRQAGCIQFDPIDVCGKSPELVLHARVKGFTKEMLYDLLYKDRTLLDYFDKNLAIIPTADWPYFRRYRQAYRVGGRSRDKVNEVCDEIKRIIREKGPVSSQDIGFDEKVYWYWNDTRHYGASGYLLKDMPGDRLIQAVRDAVSGNLLMPAQVAAKLASRLSDLSGNRYDRNSRIDQAQTLSRRELEIARLMVQGASNREIADILCLTEGTTKNYISSIYNKLGTNDRAQAISRLKELLAEHTTREEVMDG